MNFLEALETIITVLTIIAAFVAWGFCVRTSYRREDAYRYAFLGLSFPLPVFMVFYTLLLFGYQLSEVVGIIVARFVFCVFFICVGVVAYLVGQKKKND